MTDKDLGYVLEAMAFRAQTRNQLVERIVADVMRGRNLGSPRYAPVSAAAIKARIDHFADKFGNLGLTRRKLAQLVRARIRKMEYKTRWRMYLDQGGPSISNP